MPTRLLLPHSGCKAFVSVWLLVFWFCFFGACVFLTETRRFRNGLDAFNPKLPRGCSSVTLSGLGYWLILNPKPAIDSLLCCVSLLCPRHYIAKGQYCPNYVQKYQTKQKCSSKGGLWVVFSFVKGTMFFVHIFQVTLLFMNNLREKYLMLQGSGNDLIKGKIPLCSTSVFI